MDANGHADAIRDAIKAAREDGYLLQGWPDTYDSEGQIESVDLMFVRNKRDKDGFMWTEEQGKIETVYL